MEDELIWRKVKSKEGKFYSLDNVKLAEIEGSEVEKEVIELPNRLKKSIS